MAATLSDEEAVEALETLPRWERQGDAIVREVRLADFMAAITLVGRVAEVAEAANHHPDILVHGYRHVRLTSTTHSAGGLTRADIDLAAALERLLED